MTLQAFRKFVLSLPEAVEAPHFGSTTFKVGKKIFAALSADGREAQTRVFPPERVASLLEEEPEIYSHLGKYTTRDSAVGVKLAKVDAATLRELVTESWAHVAPKRARDALARRK